MKSGAKTRWVLLALLFALLCGPSRVGAQSRANQNNVQTLALTYRPAPADNPLKGFMPYAGTYTFPHSMEWFYVSLRELQTDYDRFNWQPLEARLNEIAARGHQAVFRVYLDYPNEPYGVPAFLSHVPKRAYTDYNNTKSFSPDYENADLRRALRFFISAFGRKYDGDARIGFLTVGLLGFWGEWHTHPHEAWNASSTVQNEVLDAFGKAFTRTKLLLREPKEGIDISKRALGFHDDSFAYQTLPPTDWHFWSKVRAFGLEESWKTQPIGGEVRPEIQTCLWNDDNGSCAPQGQEFSRCVSVTHASWMLNQGAFTLRESTASVGPRQRAIEAARSLGYELFVTSVSMPRVVGAQSVSGRVRLRNTGVAPFYYAWPVQFGVFDSANRLRVVNAAWNVTGILPGAPDAERAFQLPLANARGRCTLLMRVVNPLPNGVPLRFANTEQDATRAGWLTLGAFTVANRTALKTASR